MSLEIKGNLLNFVNFAESAKSDNAIVRTNDGVAISAASKDKIAPLWRSSANKNANNVARNLFKEAVAEMFGGEDKIPTDVRTAMKLDDKHFKASGKPLTARRIMAVKTMLETINDRITSGIEKASENKDLERFYNDDLQDGMSQEERREKVNSLISTAIHAAAGDKDVFDIVVASIDHFVANSVYEIRDEGKVKEMVAGLMSNMAELRAAAKGNMEIVNAGKQFFMNMHGKSMPKDCIKNLVNMVTGMKIGSIKGLSASSSTLSIHKAVKQYWENTNNALNDSGLKKVLDGPTEMFDAMSFIGAIMLARCSQSTARKIAAALSGTAADRLDSIYNCIGKNTQINAQANLSEDLRNNIAEVGRTLKSAIPGLKGLASHRAGEDRNLLDDIDLGDVVTGVPNGTEEIHNLLIPFAKEYALYQKSEFINKVVQGDSDGANKVREFHERNISDEAYHPQVNTTNRRNAILIGTTNRNICDECKKMAEGKFEDTFFYKDLIRGDMDLTLQIGDKTVKLFDNFEKARDELTGLTTNGKGKKYSELSGDDRGLVGKLLFEKARDKLASFVTKGKTEEYAKLDATAKAKVHILMSMLSQQSAGPALLAHSSALDPNGKDVEQMSTGASPNKAYAVSFGGNDQLVFECRSSVDNLEMFTLSDKDGNLEDISVGPGSSVQGSFSVYINAEEFNRLATLDFKTFDATQANAAEEDPNIKYPRQKLELLGEGFGFSPNSVNCQSNFKMILN